MSPENNGTGRSSRDRNGLGSVAADLGSGLQPRNAARARAALVTGGHRQELGHTGGFPTTLRSRGNSEIIRINEIILLLNSGEEKGHSDLFVLPVVAKFSVTRFIT